MIWFFIFSEQKQFSDPHTKQKKIYEQKQFSDQQTKQKQFSERKQFSDQDTKPRITKPL